MVILRVKIKEAVLRFGDVPDNPSGTMSMGIKVFVMFKRHLEAALLEYAHNMKKGDRIRIIRMDDKNGTDQQATRMAGRVVTVDFIDGIGQIHLKESGLSLIPGLDEYDLLDS